MPRPLLIKLNGGANFRHSINFMRLILCILAVSVALAAAPACGDEEIAVGNAHEDCPGACPDQMVPVDFCPAFTTCETVPDCDDVLTCAPAQEPFDANDEEPDEPEPVDCDEPIHCPDGTFEVPSCPEAASCTRLTLCDTDLLCQEVPQMCLFEPLCPHGDRHVPGCEDEACYRHRHCSGPVDCLHCDDTVAEECPEGTAAVDCDPLDPRCERVETCDATLHCLATCIESPICLGNSTQVGDCDDVDERDCFVIDGCIAPLHCAAPEVSDDECEEDPQCPTGYAEVDIDECLEDYYECSIATACGMVAACLPADDE